MLNTVYRGTSEVAEVFFKNADGTPFVATSPAQYRVYSFNNELILSGAGTQDLSDTSRWTATITIPDTAPLSDIGQRYQIRWSIANTTTDKSQVYTESFFVKIEGDPIALDSRRIMLSGGQLTDTLILSEPASSVSIRLVDENETTYFTSEISTGNPRRVNDFYVYDFNASNLENMISGNAGICAYLSEWKYSIGGQTPSYEYHPIYVVSPKTMMIVAQLRQLIDKAHNWDINPQLAYKDTDLVQHVLMGLQRVNGSPPQATNWTIDTLPPSMYIWVTYAAASDALFSQYLAESVSAFDFQGMAVQLTIDRGQYIDTARQALETQLEKLQQAKKTLAYSGKVGALGINIGPQTNYPSRVHPLNNLYWYNQSRFLFW